MTDRISRREFLRQSSKSVVAAVAAPYLLKPSRAAAQTIAEPQSAKLADYYRHFGVDEKLIRRTISDALSRGGDYCDLFFEHRLTNEARLEDNKVNQAKSGIRMGVGIRVLKADQTGYAFTEQLTAESMAAAARTAADIANSSKNVEPVQLKLHNCPNYYPVKTPWQQVSIDSKIPLLTKLNNRIFALDSRVIKSNIWFMDQTALVLIATSEGRIAFDYRPFLSLGASCAAEQEHRRERSFAGFSARAGFESITPERIDRIANEAVRRTTVLFDAVKPQGGQMDVVLGGGSCGILLHEAIGHGMEADFNRKQISIYADKINKSVAPDFVSIVDDGTNLNLPGSLNIDDEGNDTAKTYLVENGVLKNYLQDKISAAYYKVKPTGNGRRQSYRFAPLPRMRNTYMLPGPHKKDEIIKSVKKGLYAEMIGNGEVQIGAGDFSFYLKLGYLIEDGKLTRPVKDVNLIGNGPEVLENITMVADDLKMAEPGGICGKWGQRVPISSGLPTVKASKITVGGTS